MRRILPGRDGVRAGPFSGGHEVHRQPFGDGQADAFHQAGEIIAPRNGHRDVADSVFPEQIPANRPSQNFAESRVCICVGAPRDWYRGSELRVAQSRKSAGDGRKNEQEYHRRATHETGRTDGAENARPDDGRDAEGRQINDAQVFGEARTAVYCVLVGSGDSVFDGFFTEDVL